MQKIFVAEPTIGKKELKYVIQAVKSSWVSSKGEFIRKFEEKLAKFHGVKYATTTSNGTSALHLALIAAGVKPGDEVILPTLTFAACASTILHVGASPIFVDISEDDWNIDPKKIERAITPKTRVIMAVHLYGHPCKMEIIKDIAKRRNLFVIEDCAEAHGAKENGKLIGSFGDVSCFSFFGNKIITTGEGGACFTNDVEILETIDLYKNHGADKKNRYFHPVAGYNYRLTNLQAALGLAQLEQLQKFLKIRAKHENLYRKIFKGNPAIKFSPKRNKSNPVFWMHSFLIESKKISRDGLMEKLFQDGIETRPFFIPLHTQLPFKKFVSGKSFPVAEKIAKRGIQLPSSVNLADKEIIMVAKKVLSYV